MGSRVASSDSLISAKVACHHDPVWVVVTACHRVVRRPCAVCQEIGEDCMPGIHPREDPGPFTARPSAEASRGRDPEERKDSDHDRFDNC